MSGGHFYLYNSCQTLSLHCRRCETFPTPALNLIQSTGTLNSCNSKEKGKSGCYEGFATPAFNTEGFLRVFERFFKKKLYCTAPTRQDTGTVGFGAPESRHDLAVSIWETFQANRICKDCQPLSPKHGTIGPQTYTTKIAQYQAPGLYGCVTST